MSHMIELHNVSKFYSNKDTVSTGFSKVDLNLDMGEFVVITGESGSGKSTLLNVISGLDSYEEGELFIAGEDTSGYRTEDYERYRKKYIGNIFQDFNLVNSYTVYQNVELSMMLSGMPRSEQKQNIPEYIKMVDMTAYTKTKASKLSGGQKQRVAIAGVIAMEPECIVLDEATAMLDPSGRREVLDTVHRLNRERGITVVHITHHMSEAEDADRVIVMNDGMVAMDGAPREIFSRVEELQALGLAAPDTVELLRRLNRHGMDLPLTAITVDECARAIFQALYGAEGK